jgi:hypothetical protein
MHNNTPFRMLAVVALMVCAVSADAQVAGEKTPWYQSIAVHGFASSAFTWNMNAPDHAMAYRVFDVKPNTLSVDAAELCVLKDVAAPGDAGFRIDLVGGSAIPRIERSSGLNSGDVDFQQMTLSYIAPIGRGLRVDVGKFVTHMGYEVIEGWDGFNDSYSRSFLFGYSIPYTHTGIKASYAFSPAVGAMIMVVNGWDNAVDNNTSKTLGAQVTLAPLEGLAVFANALYGPERDNNNTDNRMAIDVYATYALGNLGTVGANMDFGSEPHAALAGGDASWTGVAGYLRIKLSDACAVGLRGEMFNDGDGARTGVAQKLTEITVTPELRTQSNLVFRADLRYDMSDQEVFIKDNAPAKSQFTIGLNAIVSF